MQKGFSKKTKVVLIAAVTLCLGVGLVVGCFPTPSGQVSCSGANMLSVPDDYAALGPYPVASRYVYVTNPNTPRTNRYYNKPFRVQILYPTTAAAVAGMAKRELTIDDIRWYLPDVQEGNNTPPTYATDWYELPDEDLYDNDREDSHFLPIDSTHGPYPVIFMVHGTSSSTTSHYTLIGHWASRGFVVVMADYHGINMRDMLESTMTFSSHREIQDTRFLVNQVKAQSGVFAMLRGHIDIDRMGIAGHSWGGSVAGQMAGTPGIRVSIPLASIGVSPSDEIETALVMGAKTDHVLNYQIDTVAGYEATRARKRLVGIPDAGHMAFADVCDIVLLAEMYGVKLDAFVKAMATDGCNAPDDRNPQYIDQLLSREIMKYATTAAFEETLQCSANAGAALDNIKSYFSNVPGLEFRQSEATPNNTNRMPRIEEGLFRIRPVTP